MHKANILLVEDDPQIAEVVLHLLRKSGHSVLHAQDGRAGLQAFQNKTPDLVLLDLNLPFLSGKALFAEMRKISPACPVIMLTCRSEEHERILGLEMGADDYICKPFVARELVARVQNLLRRSNPESRMLADAIQVGAIKLTPKTRRFAFHDTQIPLTRQEFELMQTLVSHPEQIFSRDQLITAMHEEGHPVTDRTVDACVKRIRKKLSAVCDLDHPIETCYGYGYRLKRTRGDTL